VLILSESSSPTPTTVKVPIWVDNDACPQFAREIMLRSMSRFPLEMTFVGNSFTKLPNLEGLKSIVVSGAFDAADNYIIQEAGTGSLVITSDIPLAYAVTQKGALVLTSRGEEINAENAADRLATRNLLTEFRNPMANQGQGPKAINQQDIKRFADRWQALIQRLSSR
jgi:uncharacterized protein YaiI (UPF0178 family)